MAFDKKNILLLFDRPREPVFMAKGNKNSVFDIPDNFLSNRYKPIGVQIFNKFGEDAQAHVPVKPIQPPNLSEILELKRDENFSIFVPKHKRLAGKLINMFLEAKTAEDLQSLAVYCRDYVNPELFQYALSVAILHRKDTQNLQIPSNVLFFPDKYFDSQIFSRAREETIINTRVPIEIPQDYTASNLEFEHRVAYFREDIGLNLHHWHWHLVYPSEGDRSIVDKNRRGELFYYMHQQIIARYNWERLCNDMRRVERLINWRDPIVEAYFPKLDSLVSSRTWPGRVANQTIKNINRPADQINLDIEDMFRWRNRIFDAIHSGFVQDERGNRIELTENEGIDVLGNIVEATVISPNRTFYGDLHNMGHVILSYIHDPDHRHLESFGVVGDLATTMRDPVFYRWHSYIDDIFQEFKATLPRYGTDRLNYAGITVTNIQVQSLNGAKNVFNTFWQQSDVDLSRGLDFQPRGSVFVRFTHLQQQPFTYTITVNNSTNETKMGTCRIYLGPKFDERGNPWLFRDQRLMFIELDKFTVTLRKGSNTITRKSTESSLTIPFERTFRDLDQNRPAGGDELAKFNFCGCGWPQHLLLPKGNAQGYPCELFVMISNYADDVINQTVDGECNDAASFCGLKDKLYPDRRSMGYPFDRMPRDRVNTLQEFLTPNMRVQDVTIRFEDKILRPIST